MYTIEELVTIQHRAMDMALKATHMLGQRVHRHGDYPDDADELQRLFAELRGVMLGAPQDYAEGMTRTEALEAKKR